MPQGSRRCRQRRVARPRTQWCARNRWAPRPARRRSARVVLAAFPLVREVIHLALRGAHADHEGSRCRLARRLNHVHRQPQPVLQTAAVAVLAPIRVARKELVQQVSVGAVYLDAVKPRFLRAAGRLRKAFDHLADVVQVHRVRHPVRTLAAIEGHLLPGRQHGRWAFCPGPMRIALRQRTGVHELGKDPPALRMHAVHHGPPRIALRVVGQAGLEQVTLGMRLIGVDTFGDDQPEPAARKRFVVARHLRRGKAIGGGADPSHGRDGQPVGQVHAAHPQRREQAGGRVLRVLPSIGSGGHVSGPPWGGPRRWPRSRSSRPDRTAP